MCDRGMATIELSAPGVDGLSEAVSALREWQSDQAPMQLHPGDLGWFWRLGAETTAVAVRTWRRNGQILAVGLLGLAEEAGEDTSPGSGGQHPVTRRAGVHGD